MLQVHHHPFSLERLLFGTLCQDLLFLKNKRVLLVDNGK